MKKIVVFAEYQGEYDSLRERRIKRLAKKHKGVYQGWGTGDDCKGVHTDLILSFTCAYDAINFVGVGVGKGEFSVKPFKPVSP